ncbi:MAG: tRNA (adenosine(37)-N6)-threonylcarbamoyltransferase complex dimerization subunit type 1 TsaB [Gammaproteobacteria bacterium]
MTTTLALDSAGALCSVCLAHDGQRIQRVANEPRAHANHILGLVSEVLNTGGIALEDVERLAFGEGPGGLTGLRIAASVVQGFALVTGARVVAVSNLTALAERVASGVAPGTGVLIAHEAGMGAVCAQWFDVMPEGKPVERSTPAVIEVDELTWPDGPLVVAGTGSGRLSLPVGCAWFEGEPTAASAADFILVLDRGGGREVSVAAAQPRYLRHPVDGKLAT